jgi:rubrerythrin
MRIIEFLVFKKKAIWWLVLFMCSLIYIWFNNSRIISSPVDLDKIVVIIFVLLAFMPLVQELSFAGFSMKREIESVKNELKSEVQKVKFDIMQFSINNSQNSDIKIDIGKEILPSKETMKNDLLTTSESRVNKEDSSIYDSISDNTIELFKSRFLIEERLTSIASKYEIEVNRGLKATSKSLLTAELINRRTYEYINKVLAICNRGIHGELIDVHYLDYVKDILPEILEGLSAIRFQEMASTYHECKKCGFTRISDFEKSCPECGNVLDIFK